MGTILSQLAPRERALRARSFLPSAALAYLPVVALAADLGLVMLASSVAALVRQRLSIFPSEGRELVEQVGLAFPVLVVGWLVVIAVLGGYERTVFSAGVEELRRVALASVATAGAVCAICYLIKFPLSRGYFLVTFALGLPLLLCGRLCLRAAVHRAREVGSLQHSVLLVGTMRSVDDVATVLGRERRLGYRVVGACASDALGVPETSRGVPVLGHSGEAIAFVRELGVDIVLFADGGVSSSEQMRQIAWDLEHDPVQVVVAPSVSDVAGDRVRVHPVGGLPFIHIDPPRNTDASRWGKRIFDVVGSASLLLALLPLLLVVAACIRTHDRGPVFFRQLRVGRNGVPFHVLKFRTMVTDAEARLDELHAECGFEGGMFKLAQDPRITGPGRWLRRLSIDELPQLINILRGDMSLIGPRPPLAREVAEYPTTAHRRLRVRPGLTGLWQVSGRSDLSFEEAIRLDLYYVDNWSILQDLSILGRTVSAVLRSRGAY